MKIKTLLLLILFAIISVFLVINWGEFIKPTTISLWYQTIEAPLGLILLGLIIILTVIFGIYALSFRTSLLLKERNLTNELKKAQEIANNEEASRFTELKSLIEAELKNLSKQNTENFKSILSEINNLHNQEKSIK